MDPAYASRATRKRGGGRIRDSRGLRFSAFCNANPIKNHSMIRELRTRPKRRKSEVRTPREVQRFVRRPRRVNFGLFAVRFRPRRTPLKSTAALRGPLDFTSDCVTQPTHVQAQPWRGEPQSRTQSKTRLATRDSREVQVRGVSAACWRKARYGTITRVRRCHRMHARASRA